MFNAEETLGGSVFSERFGEVLRHARKQANISREELAKSANVSTRLVAELERGQRPNVSLESTLKLLNLVGVSVVATAPDGAIAKATPATRTAVERAARAAARRRTWTGGHINLRMEGEAPEAGRSHTERLAAVSEISRQAFALSAAGSRQRKSRVRSAGTRRSSR